MSETRSAKANLAAALLLCFCFGSIHAYGVLVAPLEQLLHAGRASASLGYSVATAALTAGVFLGPRLRGPLSVKQLVVSACLASVMGLAITAVFPSPLTLVLGYGVLFGLANGVAYGLSLELASAAMPRNPATGIGLATATYGLGAVAFSVLLDIAIGWRDVQAALLCLAAALLACSISAAMPLRLESPEPAETFTESRPAASRTVALWIYFLLMTASGLMIIAHAPAIAAAAAAAPENASLASMAVSGSSIAGGYIGGELVGRWRGWLVLSAPALLQTLVLSSLAVSAVPALTIAELAVCGLCYGTAISVVPGYIRTAFGHAAFARIYGLVFTAWGVAGFFGPLAAGFLYDVSGTYGAALSAAAALSGMVAAFSCLAFSARVGKKA